MICVSVGNGNPGEAIALLSRTGFIELRADLLDWSLDDYVQVIRSGGKTVFTCRPGKYFDEERLELFEAAAGAGAAFIDIETESELTILESVKKLMGKHSTELIISYHNFELTPATEVLESVLSECFIMGAAVAKIACRVYSPADVARLLSLYGIPGRKVILGMGKSGKITRVAATILGAEFTYASSGKGSETAEGQMSYEEMKELVKKIL